MPTSALWALQKKMPVSALDFPKSDEFDKCPVRLLTFQKVPAPTVNGKKKVAAPAPQHESDTLHQHSK